MISVIYEKTVGVEEGKRITFGSGLFLSLAESYYRSIRPPKDAFILTGPKVIREESSRETGVISIEGTDGHVYVGFYERTHTETGDKNLSIHDGLSVMRLGFRFGDDQPTKPLEDRVSQFGFVPVNPFSLAK